MNRRNTAVLSVVIAMVAVACTSEDTSGGPSLTTSASAEAITPSTTAVQPGAQSLAWSKVFDVPAPFHVESIVETQGRFYALVKDIGAGDYTPSVVWASDDGTDWVELDQLSSGASLQSLVASEDGLLALGFMPAGDGHRATAWYSSDGVVWDVCDLGYVVGPASQPFTTSILGFGAAALGSIGAVATATAFPAFDWDAARRAVAAALPDELAEVGIERVGTTIDSAQVTVGPFVVFSEPLDTLGLGEVQEAQRITNSPAASAAEEPLTFRSSDLENWTVIEGNPMEAEFVVTIVSVGDEFVAAAGSLGSGKGKVFVSSDGRTWQPAGELMDGLGGLFPVGDRLVTDGWRETQRAMVMSADAGRTWEEIAGPDLSGWWITAAGPAGVLATGTEGEIGFGATPEPAVIERNGYTVTFDSAGELFTVADATGALVVSATLQIDEPNWGWGYTAPEELVFDFENETAAVQDPSTGEMLVSLTFADLDRLGSSMVSYGGDLLLFSPDAEQWTATPLAEAFGPESMLGAASVGVDRVVAVVGSGYPDPFQDEAIWVGIPVAGEAVPTVGEEGVAPEVVMGGPAPEWKRVLEFEDQGFSAILAAPSGLWAIAGDPYEFDPSSLWHSTDGLAWNQLDTAALLGEGAIVSVIVEGGPGLMAAGSVPSGTTREAVVWTSVDGEEWTMTPLGYVFPEPEEPYSLPHLWMDGLAAGPRGAVIAATVGMGFDFDLLEPSVAAALPATLRDFASGDGVMIDPARISVSVGPFQVLSEAVSDLAVDQDLFDAYGRMTRGGNQDQLLFVTDDYITWQRIDEWPGGEDRASALTSTADGYLLTTWAWGSDPAAYASLDGLTWEGAELPGDPGTVRWFGSGEGRLLMAGTLGGRSTVWKSADGGSSWTAWAGLPVDAWDVRAGGFGLVATGDHPSEWWSSSSWAPTVVEDNGLTLSIQEGRDGCSVSDAGGETLFTGACMPAGTGFGLGLPEMIRADNERAVFTVVDPSTGATLMTVSYREMDDAFEDAQDRARAGPDLFVAYSADGRMWSEQPVRDVFGTAGWVGPLAVGEDFAVVVVHEPDGPASLWRATTR